VGEGKIADCGWNEDGEKACEMALWNARVELGRHGEVGILIIAAPMPH
jgi:hypothetical protein